MKTFNIFLKKISICIVKETLEGGVIFIAFHSWNKIGHGGVKKR